MPSKDAHLDAAKNNQATIELLLQGGDEHLPWVVSVAFYKALHIIEAVFEQDPENAQDHTDDHKARNSLLKRTPRYKHFWECYRPLWEASLIARYLCDLEGRQFDSFHKYMSRGKVESRLLGHYLLQIQKSAEKYLGADFLK